MLIDLLTERYGFSQINPVLSVIVYFAAAVAALLLRRWGQVRGGRKHDNTLPTLSKILLQEIPASLWYTLFFLLTGCLKAPAQEEDRTNDRITDRGIFWGGVCFPAVGALLAFFLFTVFQLFASLFPSTAWEIPMLAGKALVCANLSSVWFSLLPLPLSDGDIFLRRGDLSERGRSLRRGGTIPFFLFTLLGLLFACITVPFPLTNTAYSLSGWMALFPLILIGG